MAVNIFECNSLTALHFKGLNFTNCVLIYFR